MLEAERSIGGDFAQLELRSPSVLTPSVTTNLFKAIIMLSSLLHLLLPYYYIVIIIMTMILISVGYRSIAMLMRTTVEQMTVNLQAKIPASRHEGPVGFPSASQKQSNEIRVAT